MSKQLALASVIVLGCAKSPTAREADCARVLRAVDHVVEGVPRRYRDAVLRVRARAELSQIEYSDPAIQSAVLGETVTYEGIQQLCVHRPSDHDSDCAALRTYLERMGFDLVPDRSRGAGIRDQSGLAELEQRAYADPAVKQAVTALVHETGVAFFTPNDSPDAAANDQRARAAYDRLAQLCQLK